MFWYDHDLSAWGWIGMSIGMIAFWALVIGGIVWLVRTISRDSGSARAPQYPSPEQILAERFARGEIDETEYRNRLGILRGNGRPAVTS